jgi:hypothetical protein
MALEVLAGPYSITTDGGTPIDSFPSGGQEGAYIQGLGLFVMLSPASEGSKLCAVQWDGTAHRRGITANITPIIPNLRDGGFAYRHAFHLYAIDILAARNDPTAFYDSPGGTLAMHVICPDRFLRFSLGTVQSSPLNDGVTFTTEYTWSGTALGSILTVSPGGAPNILCVASHNSPGQIRFYDIVKKTQVGSVLYVGEAHDGVWYVPKHNVFLEVHTKQVKVLANAVRPATLANPSALATVQAGRTVQVRTRLLGAQSEPCVGELIDWSITAGSGSLADAQTTTDADGYAYNTLVSAVGSSGNVTVQATVAF